MSSFYDNDGSWPAAARQSSWDQQQQQQPPQPAPARSATGSSMSSQPDSNAFASQFEEIDRATDNLMKSGKWFPGPMQPMAGGIAGRQPNPMSPMAGRGFEFGAGDPRLGGGGGPARQSPAGEFDGGARPGSAGLQGYYQGQRFPGGRPSEAEQMLQAKRRMAAQRERELRNYHQEQQYNRTVSGVKPDRSMSPNTMSEEDRRDLIARQHRALYGDSSSLYGAESGGGGVSTSRPSSQDVRASQPGSGGGVRGASPLAFDPYGVQSPSSNEGAVQMPPRDHVNSATSPASNSTTQQSFGLMSGAQQSSRTSNSSPGVGGESPPPQSGGGQQQSAKGGTQTAAGVAPIGTRPAGQVAAAGTNQRATTPSTLAANNKDERSTSASSNPAALGNDNNNSKGVGGLGAWGGNSGVWGSGKNLAVQPSVWG